MQRRSAILLIGVILTVGFSVVGGVGIVDVSAADTLVIDNDGTAEYSSIQAAIDDASAGDTVEIRPGTYAETIVVDKNLTVAAPDGAILDGTDVDNPDVGVTIGNDEPYKARSVIPTIRGVTITRYGTGIESRTRGGWVITDVTVRTVQESGINHRFISKSNWTIKNSNIISVGSNGIDASQSSGEWVIEDTTIHRAGENGIDAGFSSGDWTIRNVSVQDSEFSSIGAGNSDGRWVIEQSSLRSGIRAVDSSGDWRTTRSIITGDVPVSASNTLGEWRITQSIINETSTSSSDDIATIDATGAIAEGIATDNWWGSSSGPDEDACVGNVDCSNPLTTRPTDVGYNPDDEESTPTPTPTPDSPSESVTRTVSSNEAALGSTVTLTTEITGASGAVSASSSYEPQFRSATVEVTVNGEPGNPIISQATGNGSTVTLGDVGTDATVTITEELTVGEELNVTHTISGDVTLGGTTTDFEAVSVTVTEPDSVVDEFDADGNGEISVTELGQAGQAFASGELTITDLGEVGAAFAS